MKIFISTAAVLFFSSKVSFTAACFVSHRNLNSNALSTRVKNPMSDRDISMNLMIPYSSFESIHSIASQAIQNPNIEAEVFRDLAHATLDVATLFPINPIVLRIIIFVGRLFSILGDYLPDHYMTPDEMLFQLSMLTLSSRSLYDNTTKLVSTSTKSISFQDRKIYLLVFKPAGFSWMQYKVLISDALEWVELQPDQCLLDEDDSLFLTYRGDVYQDIDGFNVKRYGTRNLARSLDMVGNLSAAKDLIDSKCSYKRKLKNAKNVNTRGIGQQRSQCRLRAGLDGSLLLRIDINKLLDRANGDEKLFGNIKSLVSYGIEKRLIISLDEWQSENFPYDQSDSSKVLQY
mmetsp:Transcript_32825/g.39330  ORF Transcript_32825/g.39330 Transcript_32825/m.39330 type:complete len:346 (+) Transcript_32825:71-1108(+)